MNLWSCIPPLAQMLLVFSINDVASEAVATVNIEIFPDQGSCIGVKLALIVSSSFF